MKVFLPQRNLQTEPTNGVDRVIYIQHKLLPNYDIEIVDRPEDADIRASHVIADNVPDNDVLHLHGINWTADPGVWREHHYMFNQKILDYSMKARVVTMPSEWASMPFKRDMRFSPVVIPNGVNTQEWRPTEDWKPFALWNKGRKNDVCDPTPTVELAKRGVPVITTFIPSSTPIHDNLTVIGQQPYEKMKSLVQSSGVHLATTLEVHSLSVLEAMSSGVPILGYNWGGTAGTVEHKRTGWLVEPEDYDGLVEGYHWLIANRDEISRNCREKSIEYDWNIIIQRYAALYRRVFLEKQLEKTGVTVVITCHNYGRYLDDAIQSVLKQSYKPEEIVVVDDGSTDNSVEIASKYKNNGVLVISQSNRGVSVARNVGIYASSQPFVICLDADDMLGDRYIEVLRDEMVNDRRLGAVYTNAVMINKDGHRKRWSWNDFSWEKHVHVGNQIPCAAMFRRTMWERSGGYRPYGSCEDYEFWVRGLSLGFTSKKVSDEYLFEYRMHGEGRSTKIECPSIGKWKPWVNNKRYPMAAPSKQQQPATSYNRPVVSVIVPVGTSHVYFFRTALESLIGQYFRKWECILVDDTKDGIPPILLTPYPFVKIVRTKGEMGAGYARNIGMENAAAPLICFLDADDYLMPRALEKMVDVYMNSDAGYVYTDIIKDDGEKQRPIQTKEYSQDAMNVSLTHAVTVLMSKEDALSIHFRENLEVWEDWDFFIRCAQNGICGKRIPLPLFGWRTNTGTRRLLAANKNKDDIISVNTSEDRKMCGCSGGGRTIARQRLVRENAAPNMNGKGNDTFTLKYVGIGIGNITFKVNGRIYKGGNSPQNKYVTVHKDDVEKLLSYPDSWQMMDKEKKPVPDVDKDVPETDESYKPVDAPLL